MSEVPLYRQAVHQECRETSACISIRMQHGHHLFPSANANKGLSLLGGGGCLEAH